MWKTIFVHEPHLMKDLKLLQYHFLLLICKLDNFTFKVLYCVILYQYYIKAKLIHNTFTFPCQKFKTDYFDSSIMENVIVFPAQSRFPVKLICCIGFGSTSSACCFI